MASFGGTTLSETLNGSGLSDAISGLAGNDTLNGGGLNDTLDGGTGADRLTGGDGHDLYIVDNTKDIILETSGTHDRIQASISIDLNNVAYDGIEHLTLTGTAGLSATGDAGKNLLIGNLGANRIDGREGADTMIGGAGNDTYTSDTFQDVVREFDGGGIDTVISSEDFTMGAFIENLTFTGSFPSNGFGNELANRITGASGDDILIAVEGNDTLIGNDGADGLEGGEGADSLVGGRGNDIYYVENVGDRVVEAGLSTDRDTVNSAITYILGANIEDLFLEEDSNINGTGNTLGNLIAGADGHNVLSGLAGNDSINGAFGDDALLGGDGNDTLTADGDRDTLVGGAGIDLFKFVADSIGSGCIVADFNGLPGGDLIDVSALLTGVTAATASGFLETKIADGSTLVRIDVDGGANKFEDLTILQGVATDLNGLIANATILGIGALTAAPLAGSTGADTLAGGATSTLIQGLAGNDSLTGGNGFDTLDGGAGVDTLAGGLGGDTYLLDSTKDTIVDTGGKDRIMAAFTIDLELAAYDGIEHATLTGTGAVNASGDSDDNVLVGNSNANRLDGRGGLDQLIGGLGNDIYTVDTNEDLVVENANEGIDTVNSAVSYTLEDNVENLVLLGTFFGTGIGNALANRVTGDASHNALQGVDGNDTLTGNDGNDSLDGGKGADSMIGGKGNDTYRIDDVADRIAEAGPASDIDIVESEITYTLPSTIENLTLLDGAAPDINGTGNALANKILGNAGDNILLGLAGDDSLDGGDGFDLLLGGDGNDSFTLYGNSDGVLGGNGNDVLFFAATGELGDSVLDFDALPGRDIIDLSTLLPTATPATINDFLKAETAGGTATIQIDIDGTGGAAKFVDLVELIGVSTDLTGLLANGVILGVGAVSVPPTAGTTGNDTLAGGKTSTLIQGLAGNDSLTGGGAYDTLDGGAGADSMAGGVLSDTYIVDSTKDVIVDVSGDDDRIVASIGIDLNNIAYDGIEHVTLAGTGNLNATGDEALNMLIGNGGANRLDGKAGDDIMIGRGGNDIYEVDSDDDEIIEVIGEGVDEVHSSAIEYSLAYFVENLVLTGTADIDGTGNDLANRLTGNAGANVLNGGIPGSAIDANDTLSGNNGNDTLNGGIGADSMVGGLGADTYNVDNIGDRVIESSEAGVLDTVISTISYTLGANVELLTLIGAADLRGTGNSLGNSINGGDGNDVLNGLAGNDLLRGGLGDDLSLGGDGADTLSLSLGADTLAGGAGSDLFVIASPFDISGLNVIADFNAAVNGDILSLGDILGGYDPGNSNINDYLQCVLTADGTKIRVDTDGGADSFVDLVTLVGVSTDLTGLLNNGNLMLIP